ncbi:MAG: DsbA family protein [Rhodospirillales bacterium]|nr:DsbA family protein [Rhodospirillales bacterium]MDH3916875.1 DsbA family protein [Rhodospirillales bacterium]MDH3969825.1 DsbA family protein [Rhodospirillales bacterium]
MNRKTLFISVAGLLLLVFAGAVVLYQQSASESRNQSVLEREGAPIKGPNDAKVTIVEFFDPACGTCRDFYPLVKRLIDRYPGKVRVMVRYAPLHAGSDQVVRMLEAARYQGKFWQALELLFRSQDRWVVNHKSQPMRALTVMRVLGLDMERFSADMNRPELVQTIQRDVQDGQTLNVRATPEFFVNGRPMPSFGYDQLSRLVEEAVADAY